MKIFLHDCTTILPLYVCLLLVPTSVQTAVSVGGVACQRTVSVRCVDGTNSQGWAGRDVGEWIGSAIVDLPSEGGIVDARDATATVSSVSPIITSESTIKPNVTILLPEASWTVNDVLIKDAGCWNDFSIVGQGHATKINTTAPRTLISFVGCKTGMNRLRLSSFSYDDGATNSGQLGFAAYVWNCKKCEIDHLYVSNGGQGAIFLASTSDSIYSSESHIHDNVITSTYGSNILIGLNSRQNEVDYNNCHATHRNCIDINGSRNNVHDNTVDGVNGTDASDRYGILVFQGRGNPPANYNIISNNTVTNTDMEAIGADFWERGAGDGTKISGNSVSECGRASKRNCISIVSSKPGAAKDIEVSGNRVTGGEVNGVEVDGLDRAVVANNFVVGSLQHCFQFNNAHNYIIAGNTARNCGTGSSQIDGAFRFNGSKVNNRFYNNHY